MLLKLPLGCFILVLDSLFKFFIPSKDKKSKAIFPDTGIRNTKLPGKVHS
jgi:hypothetical protein